MLAEQGADPEEPTATAAGKLAIEGDGPVVQVGTGRQQGQQDDIRHQHQATGGDGAGDGTESQPIGVDTAPGAEAGADAEDPAGEAGPHEAVAMDMQALGGTDDSALTSAPTVVPTAAGVVDDALFLGTAAMGQGTGRTRNSAGSGAVTGFRASARGRFRLTAASQQGQGGTGIGRPPGWVPLQESQQEGIPGGPLGRGSLASTADGSSKRPTGRWPVSAS